MLGSPTATVKIQISMVPRETKSYRVSSACAWCDCEAASLTARSASAHRSLSLILSLACCVAM